MTDQPSLSRLAASFRKGLMRGFVQGSLVGSALVLAALAYGTPAAQDHKAFTLLVAANFIVALLMVLRPEMWCE